MLGLNLPRKTRDQSRGDWQSFLDQRMPSNESSTSVTNKLDSYDQNMHYCYYHLAIMITEGLLIAESKRLSWLHFIHSKDTFFQYIQWSLTNEGSDEPIKHTVKLPKVP